jgi:hypothetical protein
MQILLMLFFLVVWLLILWIGSIALESTGMERSRARFQALSAISGTGFTTSQAEEVVDNPRRRRIVTYLIFTGNAGILSFLIAIIVYVRTGMTPPSMAGIIITASVLLFIVLIIWLGVIDRITNLITTGIKKSRIKSGLKITQLYYSFDDLSVMKLGTAGAYPQEADITDVAGLQSKGINVIAIERGKKIIKNPEPETKITAEDIILCFGDTQSIST